MVKKAFALRWRPFALVGITLLGFALRLYGLNWDAGNSFQPDERQILFHVTALGWPNSFAQFLDPASSPLNPHFFAYGSFPLYLLALLGNILAHFFPAINDFANLTLVGRVLSALFDSGTVPVTGCLALLLADDFTPTRRYAWAFAFLSAALVAFTPLQLQLSHFYAVDSVLLFFIALTLLACVALVDTDAPIRWSLLAGLGFGLAMATKFSAAPLIVPLFVAALLRWYRTDLLSALSSFLLSIAVTLITFLIAMPYALLDFSNFVQQVRDQGDLARGTVVLPYTEQFAGTTPYIYEIQNMLLWGLGLMLGLAAFVGLLWLLWRVWKRESSPWLVILSWVVVYFAITGSFYVKYMRYMLPLYPFLTLMAAAVLLALVRSVAAQVGTGNRKKLLAFLPYAAIAVVLAGTMFQGLALLNVYSQPNTRIQASRWLYSHIKPGSVLTYEQWDDPLPFPVDGNTPDIYRQATYLDANRQPQTGLDLYGDDTVQKAQMLANLLPTVDVITMATDRLDKSIPRLPARYPLTIHYYQLLFSGKLGFHLAAQFENHPNLFGITLDDSGADESYSVFDHPHVRIFVRDNPYPYTSGQLYQLLLQGVKLPPPVAGLAGSQRSLLLSPQQIADDQQSPPFGVQFPQDSFSNAAPVFIWWLVLALLGWLAFPLLFPAFRPLRDRGYIFAKTVGILLFAYIAWLLANLRLLAFSHLSLLIVLCALSLCALVCIAVQWRPLQHFLRQHWRLLLLEEGIFTLAFLLFIGIRSLNPDLWNPFLGGEKPMELAFLNAILRSPYMPPYDPWFAGGYINYYYYGYVIFGALIKLTGIIPTTAFNLAIPTLFALTFSGAVTLVYNLTRRFSLALLAGYFAALIGNLNGLEQLKAQFAALLAHTTVPAFDYWQSSRIIPFTINEFPFWSFLFADLHPHVIDLPVAMLLLGVAATLCLSARPASQPGMTVSDSQASGAQTRAPQATRKGWPYYTRFALSLRSERNGGDHNGAYIVGPPLAGGLRGAGVSGAGLSNAGVSGAGLSNADVSGAGLSNAGVSGAGLSNAGVSAAGLRALDAGWLNAVQWDRLFLYGLAAFVFGTIACVNPWDMPTYALVLCAVLLLRVLVERREERGVTRLVSLGFALVTWLILCGLGYLLYWPFYAWYQELYVNGLGFVRQGTTMSDFLTVFGFWLFLALSFFLFELYPFWQNAPFVKSLFAGRQGSALWSKAGYLLLCGFVLLVAWSMGVKALLAVVLLCGAALAALSIRRRLTAPATPVAITASGQQSLPVPVEWFTYLLLLMGLCICLGQEIVYVRDFLDSGDYERMNTVFKFSMQAWLCFAVGGALALGRIWRYPGGLFRRAWTIGLVVLIVSCSIFLSEGTLARVSDHQTWIAVQPPAGSADYTPTLDGFAFVRAWYPADADAISWINQNIAGSPVILEAAAPFSYQWYSRVSVYTGLPDVLGWVDHEGEQRYGDQLLTREADINIIYTTDSTAQALALLRYYQVGYIYVGPLERQLYGLHSMAGLNKFQRMVGDTLKIVYQYNGVIIYEVL